MLSKMARNVALSVRRLVIVGEDRKEEEEGGDDVRGSACPARQLRGQEGEGSTGGPTDQKIKTACEFKKN